MDNINEIINKIKNNTENENKQLAEELKANLSEKQNNALGRLLSDKKLVAELLKSPEAKEILRKVSGDENGDK